MFVVAKPFSTPLRRFADACFGLLGCFAPPPSSNWAAARRRGRSTSRC